MHSQDGALADLVLLEEAYLILVIGMLKGHQIIHQVILVLLLRVLLIKLKINTFGEIH
jgi:hypothetical protein